MSVVSSELEEKEDRLQHMFKQIEVKNMEAQRYKTAAEVAKVIHTCILERQASLWNEDNGYLYAFFA
jgi:hypothetical protein